MSAAVGVSLLLAACGSDTGTGATGVSGTYQAPASDTRATLTISNWGNPGDEKFYDAAIARFNQRYPNVQVKNNFTQVVNWGDYINKIQASIASGDAPDVINMATEGVEYGLDKTLFQSLNNFIKQDSSVQELVSDVSPALLNGFSKDGQTYLLPNNWNTMLVYYNAALFEKAGIARPSDTWTWQDFLAIAKKLTSGSGGNQVYGFSIPTYTFAYMPWIYSNNASTASADLKTPTLDAPGTVEAIQFLADLVFKEKVAPNPTGGDPTSLFQAGKVAMTAAPANLAATLVANKDFEYDVLPMPTNKSNTTVFGAAGFAMYSGSKNKDLSWELLKELASQQMQTQWAVGGTSNPTTKTAQQSEDFTKNKPHPELFYNQIDHAKPVAAPPFFGAMDAAFQKAMTSVYAGGDVRSALKQANDEVKSTVAQNG
ncbi:sugar ABC transporter substrate-binding protein [Acrocarpospora pleiomorpha]|uniref:ABC transporter substrate-binding protein n=1 Tax=Acrocarpospora pleiomorpha TaxID=90975 RepID=UPI00147919A6|nr:sugar ABC transporter substrate-binding protein [Acrocarpospora pleiomorpha]